MRSKVFSAVLVILALASGATAFLHFSQKNLSVLFGESALPTDSRLLDLEARQVKQIRLEAGGRPQNFEKRQGQWLLLGESNPDRADFHVLEALLAFSANLTILESFPANAENRKAMGLEPARAHLTYKSQKGRELAEFSIGKKGAWHRHIPAENAYSKAQNLSSVYLQPRDGDYIYLCSSPYLEDVLANGFETQRDHRPFFFPPELLAEVTITRPNGSLVLSRSSPVAQWAISKPFQADADADAALALVNGLYRLTARKAVNKPAPPQRNPDLELSLRFFLGTGEVHEIPVTLALHESKDQELYAGRLNDWRKDIEFLIPRKSEEGRPGLDELPLSLDLLRGSRLSGLGGRPLKRLSIMTPQLPSPLVIEVSRSPVSNEMRAMRKFQGETALANELTFFTVQKTLAEAKAINTVSELSEDLSAFGLNRPILTLELELYDATKETIIFGEVIDPTGAPHFYFMRDDSPTVMELAANDYYKLASRPYLWRDAQVWAFDIIDLNLLQLTRRGQEPLTLEYSDLTQTWEGQQGSTDVTALLNENRANRYLEVLSELKVTRWLGTDHSPAANALRDPTFTITAVFRRLGVEDAPVETKTLRLAGANLEGASPFYYGQVEGDSHFFILDLDTIKKLAQPLLEDTE